MAIAHDRLFKELLRTFFWEFLELFVADLLPYVECQPLDFLASELFTDVTAGDTHHVDLVARGRFRGQETCFLVHVETQAQYDSDFARRMFRYFARLHESHGLPVYPIALFSYPTSRRPVEPERYQVAFPHRRVLDFHFHTIELNRLDWRDFLRRENPVASALMTRMRIAPEERPRVKSACLRMLAGLRLDEARAKLVSGFVDTYLNLDEKENTQFMQELDLLELSEREAVMELTTSWKEEGRQEGLSEGRQKGLSEGRQEGLRRGLALALQLRFGERGAALAQGLGSATAEQLAQLEFRLLTAEFGELEQLLSR